jgi:hypothetical protein
MQIQKMKTTKIVPWSEHGYQFKGTVSYGMHYIQGNSSPHFAITAITYRRKNGRGRWTDDACGCQHDLIAKKKRGLKELIPFHLHDQDGLPMHYSENAWYWYQGARGWKKTHLGDYQNWSDKRTRQENWKVFCKHILLEEGEKLPRIKTKQDLVLWLESRVPRLKQRFDETMKKFGIEYITKEEIERLLERVS